MMILFNSLIKAPRKKKKKKKKKKKTRLTLCLQ